ncbi:MAG: glutamate 5-kinase [Planctomycetota bacterium]|nr:glutamate 5-kinase [Planctomycetota bacterium]MDA0919700.1 glutamate 5-kinase [Planctomycetota bacterium]MDA1161272.1 glutamate 5-kinase [Planctomycetota bacterium]
MQSLIRQEIIQTARTVVIKVGTSVLSNDDDSLDVSRIAGLTEQIYRIRQTGRRVVLVSSGAVGAGMGLLNLKQRPSDLPHLQAAAAAGQAHLIRLYNDCLEVHGFRAAQLLLTANDFRNRERYLNVRNTLNTLFEFSIIPIINENDTVSISEIQFGDNDQLAAMVNNLLEGSLLIVLSVIDGLLDGNPDSPDSQVIPVVERWDEKLLALASSSKSRGGTGGMKSKLQAARKVTEVGENVIIANGRRDRILDQIMAGDEVGTLFLAQGRNVPAWKRWIGYTVEPRGRLKLDAGAKKALTTNGRSLLAIGITEVEGKFGRGDVVSLLGEDGLEFARGLTNYDSPTTARLKGLRLADLPSDPANLPYEEIVHRDNLLVFGQDSALPVHERPA